MAIAAEDCDDDDATVTTDGTGAMKVSLSCLAILSGYDDGDGNLDRSGWIGTHEVYDMTTDDGGWTLVIYIPDAGPTTELYRPVV